jgi:ferredoxin
MVPAGSILSLAASGVPVGLTACGDACFPSQRVAVKERIDYCRELLRSFGASPEMVRLVGPEDDLEPIGAPARPRGSDAAGLEAVEPGESMFGPAALGQALRMLKEEYGAPATLTLDHPGSPAGVVEVDPELCTVCGVCAEACPTGALVIRRHDELVELVFDGSLCAACEQCLPVCPESTAGAIDLKRTTDFARLTGGQETLCRDQEARCEACGAPVASLTMLSRIESLLGQEDAALVKHLGRYCLSCKGNPAARPG